MQEPPATNQSPELDRSAPDEPEAAGIASVDRSAAYDWPQQLYDVFVFGKDGPVLNIATDFPSDQLILDVSAGYEWSAALLQDHCVYTWGNNTGGQLGHGDAFLAPIAKPTLVAALVGIRIVRISCGSTHGGFISDVGALYMVGDGQYGRLGTGSADLALVPVQVTVTYDELKERGVALGTWPSFFDERGMKRDDPTTFADVSCGDRHTLVLVRSVLIVKQAVLAFGDGSNGRLGLGTDKDRALPCLIGAYKTQQGIIFPPIQKIHAGASHSTAIAHTGELYTWGNGGHGRLGHGSEESDWSPRRVEYFTALGPHGVLTPVKQAVCGGSHTAALDVHGRVYSWGRGDNGQLGLAAMKDAWTPHVVALPETTPPIVGRAIAAGRLHTWLVDVKDQVYCWGDNSLGQLGSSLPAPFQPTPMLLPSTATESSMSVALADFYSLLVVKRDATFHSHVLRSADSRSPRRGLWAKRPWRRSSADAKAPTSSAPVKWSFAIQEPTENLDVPSSTDRFLQLMTSTKIAKRLPRMHKQASMEMLHRSHAKLATFHLTQTEEPEAKIAPTKPVAVKGLASWRARRTVKVTAPTSSFAQSPRFAYRPPAAPPMLPEEALVAAPPRPRGPSKSGAFFGLAKRTELRVPPTPGPGSYDIPVAAVCADAAPFGSTTPKLACRPRPPYAHEAMGGVELHPDKAAALVFPSPASVKLDAGQDFSRVVQRHLLRGKGTTPGPGAYSIT
ncbi:regulator of chromosome condensation (RCC1)-like protein [Achlya hypogyna]|uniref:Regulator of chromosome condensation (RCC1)-like protein n=1 Tax=Achlya hypogyna TaxID=1202772 RepID=A0A1V9YAU4_ACHHY|nr:regulator of chromosome condensation (RCC1)-like protein [Achlya hypogyna]